MIENLENEIWKDIEGYEGLYQVSSRGRIKSIDRYDSMGRFKNGKILKFKIDKGGYCVAHLYKNKKHKYLLVHRAVAIAFIPNDDTINKKQVNHIKEFEKDDNSINNLEWMTPKENSNYGTRTERVMNKITGNYRGENSKISIKIICLNDGNIFFNAREASEHYNITKEGIRAVCNNKRNKVYGLVFVDYNDYLNMSKEDIEHRLGGMAHEKELPILSVL